MKAKVKEPKTGLAEKAKTKEKRTSQVTEPVTTNADSGETSKVKEQSGENPIGTPP